MLVKPREDGAPKSPRLRSMDALSSVGVRHIDTPLTPEKIWRPDASGPKEPDVPQLQPVDQLIVNVALDNLSDNYSSKPAHVSSEFNNVMAAGARELSGRTLCCAQLGLALVLTASVGQRRYKLLFDAGPEGSLYLRNCQNLGVSLADVEAIAISHGHWDHMGALLDVLDHITQHSWLRQVPCHVNRACFWSAARN